MSISRHIIPHIDPENDTVWSADARVDTQGEQFSFDLLRRMDRMGHLQFSIQANEMTEEKKKPPFPFLKLLALIFVVLVGGTLLFSAFLGGGILYTFDHIDTHATRVETDDPESEEHAYLSIKYEGCDEVYEHIDLGRKELKGKVPEQLQEMRACLAEVTNGQSVAIRVERRTQRITGSRSGRVTQVGKCVIEPFPSKFEFKGDARCPWM